MTYEAEMKEYLYANGMPENEGTYPEEMMAQITIKAFEDLAERIAELEDQLEVVDEKHETCQELLRQIDDGLKDMYSEITNMQEIIPDA